jgi:hypothetical protein
MGVVLGSTREERYGARHRFQFLPGAKNHLVPAITLLPAKVSAIRVTAGIPRA